MMTLKNYIIEALDGSKMTYSGKNQDFVDVILEDPEGKILILRRANYMKNFRTCWGLIGGAIEKNDNNSAAAVVREVREETGIEIDAAQEMQLRPIFTYTYKNGNVTDVFYIKLDTDPHVTISREHSKYEWIDFSNEKIDNRKWIPEVFNILQRWEELNRNTY